jgi:hypothetical protein
MRIIGLDIHRAFAEAVAWHDGKLKRLGRVDMRDSIPRSVISVHNSSKASTPGRRSNQRHDPCPAQGAHSTRGQEISGDVGIKVAGKRAVPIATRRVAVLPNVPGSHAGIRACGPGAGCRR